MRFDSCVNIIAGTRVAGEDAVLQAIGQGATFQQVKGVRHPTFTRADASPV
jgi:stage V sporulation protein SpoVS